MKTYWGDEGIALCILDLWRWVFSFMSRPLYHRG